MPIIYSYTNSQSSPRLKLERIIVKLSIILKTAFNNANM